MSSCVISYQYPIPLGIHASSCLMIYVGQLYLFLISVSTGALAGICAGIAIVLIIGIGAFVFIFK